MVVARAVVTLVGDAHLELLERRQHVELGDRDLAAGVERDRVLEHHEVEPPRTTTTTGVGAELVTALDQLLADGIAVEQLGGERAAADARDVGLGDADHAVDGARADTGAGAHTTRDRVRRRDERIRAVVEVEVRGLRALEQHGTAGLERLVHEVHGVVDHRREARHHRQVLLADLVGVEREPVVDLGQHAVLLAQREVELLAEDLGVEEVLHAQAHAQRLVGVGGADAALGGAELVLAEEPLGDAVELLVVRHDQVRVARQLHARGVDALALEHVELVDEHRGVDDHAVADDGGDVRVEHAARHQLQREHLVADDDAVARVVTTLVANDEVALLRQVVGEAALALVTPLGADDHRPRHASSPDNATNTGVTLERW